MRKKFITAAMILLGVYPNIGSAQSDFTFADFDLDKATAASGSPRSYTQLGNKFVFSARTLATGLEPWVSDGTQAGTMMLKDIYPGVADSDPVAFTELGGKLYFKVLTPAGPQLWETDGTSAGTKLAVNMSVWVTSSSLKFDVYQGKLYFIGNDAAHGYELWSTDGTPAGTQMVKDIYPGPKSSSSTFLCEMNGKLYFTANDSVHGAELWVTDGTGAGTQMVTDINTGVSSSNPQEKIFLGGSIYFSAYKTGSGSELWKSDGTPAGTQLVKDIYPGTSSSYGGWPMIVFNGKLYLVARDDTHGDELWSTDGTMAGTQMVKDISPGSNYSLPSQFAVYKNRLFFSAIDTTAGRELWSTDGTAAGTTLFKDLFPGKNSGSPSYMTVHNDLMYFSAKQPDSISNTNLWYTDGTDTGTYMIAPPFATVASPLAAAAGFFPFSADSSLYFTAEYTNSGVELWSVKTGAPAACDSPAFVHTSVTSSGNLFINWQNVPNALSYEYYVMLQGSTKLVTQTTTANSVIVKGLLPGMSYEVCVKSICKGGRSGSTCNTLATPTGIAMVPGSQVLNIYPNPADGRFTVNIPGGATAADIAITNVYGQVVCQRTVRNSTDCTFDLSSFAKGVYMVQMHTDNGSYLSKLILR